MTWNVKSVLKDKNFLVWIISHLPFFVMLFMLICDYKMWQPLTPYSGYFSVTFFVITLGLNPLIKYKPFVWAIQLNRYRRPLGVASFSYALIHLLCFTIKRIINDFWNGWIYFFHPSIIPALFIAFPILFLLAVTSNQYSLKKLSFPKWKQLHTKAYIAEASIILHMILTGNTFIMALFFLPLLTLQLLRRRKKTASL